MDFVISLLNEPVLYLILAGTFLCVVLPWLKKKAEETPTVLDDGIWTLVELWIGTVVRRILGK